MRHDVEQRTEEWFNLRYGIPTASMFSNIITSMGDISKSIKGYATTLAGERFAGKSLDRWTGNQWTDRGTLFENEARPWYSFMTDLEVTESSFYTHDEIECGCSPDGEVGDDGLIEIKCLKAENHIKALMYIKSKDQIPRDYIQQVQGEMFVTGRKWCDFIVYHPDLPSKVHRVQADFEFHEKLKAAILQVNKRRDEILTILRS